MSAKPTEGGGGPGLRVRQIGQELQIAPYPPEQKCTLLGGPQGGVVFEATPIVQGLGSRNPQKEKFYMLKIFFKTQKNLWHENLEEVQLYS